MHHVSLSLPPTTTLCTPATAVAPLWFYVVSFALYYVAMPVLKAKRKTRVTVTSPSGSGPGRHARRKVLGVKALEEEKRMAKERQRLRTAGATLTYMGTEMFTNST